jgi:hypothetical protein
VVLGDHLPASWRALRRSGSVAVALSLAISVTAFAAPPADTAPPTGDEPTPVGGIEIDPFVEPFPLEIGPWKAAGSAQGTATASEQGFEVTWTGRIPAQFDFSIADGGAATGRWEHQGDAIQRLSGSAGGQQITATGRLSFTGNGTVGGTNSQLTLTGSSTTTGNVVASTAAGSFGIPVDGTNPLPTLRLDIAAVSCDEAYGEWAYTVVQAFEGEGFTADFGGYWHAIRETEEVNQSVANLVDATYAGGEGGELVGDSPLLRTTAAIVREYNNFVDAFPGWTLEQVLDIATRTESLLAAVRNLTDCDKRLFGEDNIEVFVNALTFVLQGLIIGAPPGSYSSTDFEHLVHVAVRSGALGPGAPNPAQAVAAETALIRAGEAILEANLDPADNKILVNGDTRRVMATGAAMGWDFTVGGETYDARGTYEANLGDSWQATAPASGEGG